MDNQTLTYTNSTNKKLTKNTYKLDGYEFLGWASKSDVDTPDFTDEAVVHKLAGEAYGPDGDKDNTDPFVLYAIWRAKKYKVNFNLNDRIENSWGTTTSSDVYRNDGQPVNFNRKNYELEFTYDEPIGTLVGRDGGNLPNLRATQRVGYDFVGWVSTMSGVIPKEIARSERMAASVTKDTVYRATSNITFYAMWSNKEYNVNYNVDTRNYSTPDDRPNLTIPEGRDKVYFDCVFGSDGEHNGVISNPGPLPTSDGGQFAFKGWYYDQKFYLNDDLVTIKDIASPAESTRIESNRPVFDYDIYKAIIATWSWADIPAAGFNINGWYAGKSRSLYINPNGGELWFGGKSNTRTVGHRLKATDSFVTQIDVSFNTKINEGGADALPENTNPWFQDATAVPPYFLSDKKDAVYRGGYTFKGWKTVRSDEGRGALVPGYVTNDNPAGGYWSDAEDSYLKAEWEARKYRITYDVNIPKKPGSTADASTRDLLSWVHPDPTKSADQDPDDKEVTFDTIIQPAAGEVATFSIPVLPGYKFKGWYIYQKDKNNKLVKTRLDTGVHTWKYVDFDKFYDPKGQNEYFIVSVGYPATSYYPTGETREVKQLKIYAEWEANEYVLKFDGYKGDADTDYSFKLNGKTYTSASPEATVSMTFDAKIQNGQQMLREKVMISWAGSLYKAIGHNQLLGI